VVQKTERKRKELAKKLAR